MGWTKPIWLLALVIIIPIFQLGNIFLRKQRERQGSYTDTIKSPKSLVWLTVFRVAVIGMVILALAGTSMLIPSQNCQTVILLDVSQSIGQIQTENARRVALQLLQQFKSVWRAFHLRKIFVQVVHIGK